LPNIAGCAGLSTAVLKLLVSIFVTIQRVLSDASPPRFAPPFSKGEAYIEMTSETLLNSYNYYCLQKQSMRPKIEMPLINDGFNNILWIDFYKLLRATLITLSETPINLS